MPARGPFPRKSTHRPFRKDPATLGVIDAAYRLQKAGSFQQAEILYRRVLGAEPGNPFALCALGTIALRQGRMEDAIGFLGQALNQGYDHDTVYTHLGIALQTLGRDQEALEVYQRGLRRHPKNAGYLSNIAVILAHQGHPEAALAEAEKAISLDGRFTSAFINAGFFLQTLGRLPEAAQRFERALSLEPDNAAVKDALLAIKHRLALESH